MPLAVSLCLAPWRTPASAPVTSILSLQVVSAQLGYPPALWSPGSLQRLVMLPSLFSSANGADLEIVIAAEERQLPEQQVDGDEDVDVDEGAADEHGELHEA